MIVACPNCHTQFEFDAARVSVASVKLKCSRCRSVFPAPSNKKQAPPLPIAKKQEPPRVTNLELPFEDADWRSGDPTESLVEGEADEAFTLGDELGRKSVLDIDLGGEPAKAPMTRGVTGLEPMFGEDDDEGDELAEEPTESEEAATTRREGGMVWAILVFLVLVLLGYGGLTGAFFADPEWRDRVLAQLPFVAGNGNDRLLHRKIALSDVVGSHQSIRDDKNVLVINGNAYNTAAEPLLNVQIVSTLFDANGREVARKAIHLGNVISTKVLSEMTRKEIEVFHNLNVSWRNIEPGQTYPFVIVFTDPPKSAIDFTTKVTSAFRQRS